MKKLIGLLFVFLFSCKSYTIEFREYENSLPKHAVKKALSTYDAESVDYSLLIFTESFYGEHFTISTGSNSRIEKAIITNKNLGLAEIIKISNNDDTKLKDLKSNSIIVIEKELAKSHKFIYIEKHLSNKKESKAKTYTIIYSNTLLGFM